MAGPRGGGFMRHWFAIEAIPLYAIMAVAIGGGSWYLSRLARGPNVVWTNTNKEPWNTVQPNQSTKMYNVNDKLDSSGFLSYNMVMPLDSPQPSFVIHPSANIKDTPEETPEEGLALSTFGPSSLPALIFGGGAFSNQYNSDDHLESLVPLRTVRTALRYGITAFDTSAYYGPSEIVLGAVLKGLAPEFPRSSYQLMTKCGRYGVDRTSFDYSPRTIRRSVERSLARLNTSYLDVVYLHDVEFVAEEIMPRVSGNHLGALGSEAEAYGLKEGNEAKVWGKGDQIVLDAFNELRKLKAEGLVRRIGITGYPLPTLLRLSLLILHTPPYTPLDVLLSYSHSNLQNTAFTHFAPYLTSRARIPQLISASPLNMGLLREEVGMVPGWHPAPGGMREATGRAGERVRERGWVGGLPELALGYAMREDGEGEGSKQLDLDPKVGESATGIPVVIGLSSPAEVHKAVKAWRTVHEADVSAIAKRKEMEREVIEIYRESGYADWSWASPSREEEH